MGKIINKKVNILILEKIFPPILPSKLKKKILIKDYSGMSRKKYLDIIHNFQVIIIKSRTVVDNELIAKAKNLRVIARAGVGVENIDIPLCNMKNIKLITLPGKNANSAAEFSILMALVGLRNINAAFNNTKNGYFDRFKLIGKELNEIKIGVLGYGNVGKLFVKKAISLGTKKIIVFTKDFVNYKKSEKIQFTKKLNFLLKSCDVISIHLPLNKFTKYLLDYKNLTYLKNNSILINTSRGDIVNNDDILKIIRIKNITYFLDVVSEEPNYETEKKQTINKKFFNNSNIFITPHLAAITENTQKNISHLLFNKIIHHFGIK